MGELVAEMKMAREWDISHQGTVFLTDEANIKLGAKIHQAIKQQGIVS